MAYASPVDACGPVEAVPRHLGNRTHWIALIRRNLCSFVQKVGSLLQNLVSNVFTVHCVKPASL